MRKRRSHSDGGEDGFEYSTGSAVSALSVECFASHSQLGDDRITYTHFVELLCEFKAAKVAYDFYYTTTCRISLGMGGFYCSACGGWLKRRELNSVDS